MSINNDDKKIVIGVLLFSFLIIVGIGFGFGFATSHSSSEPETKSEKQTVVQTAKTTMAPTAAMTTKSPTPDPNAGNKEYSNAAVATDSGKCSEIGRDILKKKGSAVDAAIASSFCCGVINMHSTGIGGGGFMLIYSKSKGVADFIDYREEAPAKASENMFEKISSTKGGKSTGIPGEVRGLYEAHQKYGKLDWKDLVQPSIDLANEGFPLPIPVYEAILLSLEDIKKDYGLRELLFNGDEMKKVGDIIKNPQLSVTMEKIRDNPMSFYNGCLADDVVRDVKRADGIITKEDLRNYRAKWKNVVKSDWSDMTLYSTASPSSGPVITMILNILKGYNMNKDDVTGDDNAALTYHRIIEAFKYAYAWRSKLGDPDFNSTDNMNYTNIEEITKNMTNRDFAEAIRKRIKDDKTYHDASYYGTSYDAGTGDEGTSHLSVFSANGDAVSVTSTINFRFGAKYRSPVTGIIYNNEMDDFSTPGKPNGFGVRPSPSNYIKPGKRPMSSMCPIIFVKKDKSVRLIAGGAGGTRITTAASLVAMNNLWFGDRLDIAVKKPRIHNQLSNTTYEVKDPQYTLSAGIRKGLASRGNFLIPTKSYAVVQAIAKESDKIFAQSDPRKHGWAAGY